MLFEVCPPSVLLTNTSRKSLSSRIRRCCLLLLFAVPVISTAQVRTHEKVDSIQRRIQLSKRDTVRVELMAELALEYARRVGSIIQDIDSANYWTHKADSLNKLLGGRKSLEVALARGRILLKTNDFDSARVILLDVAEGYRRRGDIERQANTILAIGTAIPITSLKNSLEDKIGLLKRAASLYHGIKPAWSRMITIDIADNYSNAGQIHKAKSIIDSLLQANPGNSYSEYIPATLLLARIHNDLGSINIALNYVQTAAKAMEQQSDTTYQFLVYVHMASLNYTLENYQEASVWYHRLIGYTRKVFPGYVYFEVPKLINSLIALGKANEGVKLIEKLVRDFPPQERSDPDRFTVSFCLANCYAALGKHALAEAHYEKSLEYSKDKELRPEHLNDMGKFYLSRKQYAKARQHLQKSLYMSETFADVGQRSRAYHLLSRLDSATGNFQGAYIHLLHHKTLHDSIFSAKKSAQIEELKISYETDKKEQSIDHLSSENLLQQSKLKQAGLIQTLTFSGIALLIIVLGLLYNQFRLKKKSNQQLEHSRREISDKNTILENVVAEKEWLLKEIHHRVKNNLQTIVSLLESQAQYVQNHEALSAIIDSQNRVNAMSIIHQKLFHTPDLTAISVQSYLPELIQYLRDSFTTNHIRFVTNIHPLDLDVTQAIPVGLIINEAITNAIKYAFPTSATGQQVSVTLSVGDHNYVMLLISDNGVGLPADFDIDGKDCGLGLKLMQGLATDIDGQFQLQSDHGLAIEVTFTAITPLSKVAKYQ